MSFGSAARNYCKAASLFYRKQTALTEMLDTADDRNLESAGWEAMLARLNNRSKRSNPYKILASFSAPPLAWCVPATVSDGPAAKTLASLHQALCGKGKQPNVDAIGELAQVWLEQLDERTDLSLAYEAIAWADAAPLLADDSKRELWERLVDKLCDLAEQANVGRIEQPLLCQLLAGELPYTLAVTLEGFERCDALAEPSVDVMSRAIQHETDGEGLPQAAKLLDFRPLLASWTRCQLRSPRGQHALDEDGQAQYEWAVSQFLRLTRFDGGQVLGGGSTAAWSPDFASALLADIGDSEDHAAARVLLPNGKRIAKSEGKSQEIDRQPTVYSEWSELAVMRTHWKKQAVQWATSFHGRGMQSELSTAKSLIWQGDWITQVRVDGSTLTPSSDWEEICWTEDADVNYLELEIQLGEGWRLQRQLTLILEDQLLFIADAILGSTNAELEYETRLPVGEQITFRGCDETNDGRILKGDKPLAHVLPLALPEWRAERGDGSLQNTLDGLTYTMKTQGAALYAPLLLDLNTTRVKQEPTWRRLTVACKLEIEPRDQAVGYRVQVGPKQWLIYRSLTATANRSILGQNLTSEFIFGRIDRQGDVENLVEVE